MRKPKHKTVERLLKYLEYVKKKMNDGNMSVFSHELAKYVGVSPAQVRQDLMDLEIKGTPQSGYSVEEFFNAICSHLKCEKKTKVILIGVGNLGKAILSYFLKRKSTLEIAAAFDSDAQKTGRIFSGTPILNIEEIEKYIKRERIKVAIITTPQESAQRIADLLVRAGIRSIVNFAPVMIQVPENVFVEQIDITLSIEKAAYFADETLEAK
ncbi:MAG: redox-sensing transcriptional repressor Rex [Elusimicrobiales bacterium]|nr:redox-sensing transcriptional repressor Rex [Elusimicrobiales bacterium]